MIYSGRVGIYIGNQRVAHCDEKGHFGEIALDRHSVRTADVVAEGQTTLFVLNSIDYNRILFNFKSLERHYNYKLFVEVPLFSGLSYHKLQDLVSYCAASVFKKNEVIYDYGCKSYSFYVVKSGTVELQVYSSIKKQNKWPVACNLWNIRKVKSRYALPLKLAEKGGYFGEYEIVNKRDRETRAIALEDCVCLSLAHEDFNRYFSVKDQNAIDRLNLEYSEKIELLERKYKETISKSNENHSILSTVMDHSSKKLDTWKESLVARKKLENQDFNKRIVENTTKNTIKNISCSKKFEHTFQSFESENQSKQIKRSTSEIPKVPIKIRSSFKALTSKFP